jgi:cholesterol oxidase
MATTKPSGLRFSESLSGYLGRSDDHWAAYEAGRAANLHARFWITVRIPDLQAFIADPEHEASLKGRLTVAGMGHSLPVEDGRILLFCLRGEGKRLLYFLPFEHSDRRFLLQGEKRLSRPKGLDAWRQMTTLFTDVLQQADDGETLLYRGVLRISLPRVLLQAVSFRPLGTANPLRFLADYVRFLRFSSREMRR